MPKPVKVERDEKGNIIDRDWNKRINPLHAYGGDSNDPQKTEKSISGNFGGIQGAGNEQLVAARALKHGFLVFFKEWSDAKYDMVIDCEGELFKAQVKGTTRGIAKFTTRLRGGEVSGTSQANKILYPG